jgi:hypothetical protein
VNQVLILLRLDNKSLVGTSFQFLVVMGLPILCKFATTFILPFFG